jgi:hypothetical protein
VKYNLLVSGRILSGTICIPYCAEILGTLKYSFSGHFLNFDVNQFALYLINLTDMKSGHVCSYQHSSVDK